MIIDRTKDIIYIFTDGSCRNKDGKCGGYGIVLLYKQHKKEVFKGQFINTTSARMELKGVIEALKLISDKTIPIELYCDNRYVVDSISERWAFKWERENWYERKNADLLKELLREYRQFPQGNVQFIHVKGHNNNEFNERCDKLAAEGGRSSTIIDDTEK